MVYHYLIIGTRHVNAWHILQKSEKIREMRFMNKTDYLLGLATIDWMQIFSDLTFDPKRMTNFHEISESALNSNAAIKKGKV